MDAVVPERHRSNIYHLRQRLRENNVSREEYFKKFNEIYEKEKEDSNQLFSKEDPIVTDYDPENDSEELAHVSDIVDLIIDPNQVKKLKSKAKKSGLILIGVIGIAGVLYGIYNHKKSSKSSESNIKSHATRILGLNENIQTI